VRELAAVSLSALLSEKRLPAVARAPELRRIFVLLL